MLKHKCPKCGNDLGYKWNTKLYSRGYQCPKCKSKLETTLYLTLAMFLTFLIGLSLTDYIAPMLSFYAKHPQITRTIVTLLLIGSVWMIVTSLMPRM
jgi:DNA-directed RNA polymerase subunit RPC12/RpoP